MRGHVDSRTGAALPRPGTWGRAMHWAVPVLVGILVPTVLVADAPNPKAPAPPVPVLPAQPVPAPRLQPPVSAPEQMPHIQVLIKNIRVDGLRADGPGNARLLEETVTLGEHNNVWSAVAPEQGPTIKLKDIGGLYGEGRVVDASALQAIVTAVANGFIKNGVAATRVSLTQQALNHLTAPDSDGLLVLTALEARVAKVRTLVAKDGKVSATDATDYPAVAENSPVQAGDMVWIRDLDQYIYRANRYPGRQVDVSLSPGVNPGAVNLEYLVTADKPWLAYFELNNTGTKETSQWRERLGATHFNLTGADDIVAVDYITGGFDKVHAVTASYERPFPGMPDLRAKIYGSWSSYDASDVGLANVNFSGDSSGGGGELIWNFFQRDALFLDAAAGVQYRNIRVNNDLAVPSSAAANFLLPYLSLRGENRTFTASTIGSATLETGWVVGNTSAAELDALGRVDAERSWVALHYDVSHAFYLEPLFDENFGKSGSASTLAHEIYLASRGQYTPHARLTPNFMQTVGGFYTVRGYPESFAIGDSGFIQTAEYRFHLPRIFTPAPPGQIFGRPFRLAPEQPLARPDWDLLLRAFVDVGTTIDNRPFSFEAGVVPVGAGIGAELALGRNVDLRVDWGFALTSVNTGSRAVSAGSSRVHLSFMVLY